jgi:predicted ArsR family transcriptional regulator
MARTTSTTSTTKPRPRQTKLETAIVPFLFDNPNSSAQEMADALNIKVQPVYLFEGINQEVLRVSGKVESGKRGRPANRYSLTDKARKRVQRARAAAEKAAQAQVEVTEPATEPVAA